MRDPFTDFSRAMWRITPHISATLFLIGSVLMAAWLLGQGEGPVRDALGSALNLKFTSEEGVFFGCTLAGSAAMYGFSRATRDYF